MDTRTPSPPPELVPVASEPPRPDPTRVLNLLDRGKGRVVGECEVITISPRHWARIRLVTYPEPGQAYCGAWLTVALFRLHHPDHARRAAVIAAARQRWLEAEHAKAVREAADIDTDQLPPAA